MIDRERSGDVTVLRFRHGKASALDPEFLDAIAVVLEAEAAAEASAVVLTGSGSIFSAGVDLKQVLTGGSDYTDRLVDAISKTFATLFTLPIPVVAAVNGHAIAGGAVMTCACDRRIMANGRGRIGVPEIFVGVPFPAVALEIMRAAVGTSRLAEVVYSNATYTPADALDLRLVDECVDADAVLERALAAARDMAGIPADVFRMTKEAIRRDTVLRWQEGQAASDAAVRAAWASDDVRDAIARYVARALPAKREPQS